MQLCASYAYQITSVYTQCSTAKASNPWSEMCGGRTLFQAFTFDPFTPLDDKTAPGDIVFEARSYLNGWQGVYDNAKKARWRHPVSFSSYSPVNLSVNTF